MRSSSVVSLLRERAGLQPDDVAFRYTDYEQDWAGVTETLTSEGVASFVKSFDDLIGAIAAKQPAAAQA